jgi:Kef-type K+ transport system membrane component KefB
MPSFSGLLVVITIAFAASFLLGLVPRIRLPSVVVEIVAGIVVGPSVLGWVHLDETLRVVSTLGLAFLLFLAGLEIDFSRLRGRVLKLTALGYAVSFGVALVVAGGLKAAGLVHAPLLIAITLAATSLGVLIPVLKDAGESGSTLGQVVIAAGSIADFGAIILLSVFFTGEGGTGATLLLIGSLLALAAVVVIAVRGAERSMRIRADLLRLQDTTAQIRVRGAMVLLIAFAAIAEQLGLEAILGTFAAGAILTLLDQDRVMTHPQFRLKLEAVGFGLFIPVFFVTTGVRYDLDALLAGTSTLVMVPIFLAALLLVRGLPALLYRRLLGARGAAIAGLLQATSLPFIVAATAIGLDLGVIDAATSAALVAAGLLSVVIFPAAGLALLRAGAREDATPHDARRRAPTPDRNSPSRSGPPAPAASGGVGPPVAARMPASSSSSASTAE